MEHNPKSFIQKHQNHRNVCNTIYLQFTLQTLHWDLDEKFSAPKSPWIVVGSSYWERQALTVPALLMQPWKVPSILIDRCKREKFYALEAFIPQMLLSQLVRKAKKITMCGLMCKRSFPKIHSSGLNGSFSWQWIIHRLHITQTH